MRAGTLLLRVLCGLMLLQGCAKHAAVSQQRQQFEQGLSVQRDFDRQFAAEQKMLFERQQAQQQMLAALTPAHRQLLARVVGELAIATQPHVLASVNELDAALEPAEKSAILSASASLQRKYEQLTGRHAGAAQPPEDPGATLLLTVTHSAFLRTALGVRSRYSPHQVKI